MASLRPNAARFFLAIISVMATGLCGAQQCRGLLADDSTNQRFERLSDGTVIDQHTHLVWMRCSVGQHWDNAKSTCNGEAQSLAWLQAKQYASKQSNGGWRLPSIDELSSITELRCYNPAIDLKLFPQTPASHYWSATPFANRAGHYWLVQFLSGENHTDSGKRLAFVRLVKTLGQSTLSR